MIIESIRGDLKDIPPGEVILFFQGTAWEGKLAGHFGFRDQVTPEEEVGNLGTAIRTHLRDGQNREAIRLCAWSNRTGVGFLGLVDNVQRAIGRVCQPWQAWTHYWVACPSMMDLSMKPGDPDAASRLRVLLRFLHQQEPQFSLISQGPALNWRLILGLRGW